MNEQKLLGKWSKKRIRDFSTGRFCARQAMSSLGVQPADILMGASNEPLWPLGIVGSISHSDHLVGAVVAYSSKVRSVGMDIETIAVIEYSLWNAIFTPHEINYLSTLSVPDVPRYATLLFSFKESFFKCQFPLTRLNVDFLEVEIRTDGEYFTINKVNGGSLNKALSGVIMLGWIEEKNTVITFCYLSSQH